jgi:hypothetical protein
MTRKGKAELISFDHVKQKLRRGLKDTSKIDNLPPLPTRRTVTQVGIQNCSATQDGDTIKVHGEGWVDLDLVYGNAEIGEIEVTENFPITYSAEFTNDRTLLSCEAVVNPDHY